MRFEYKRVIPFLFFGQCAECNGTCNICRTILILRAAVEQQEALRFQRNIRFRSRFIMHNGAVLFVTGNGVETDTFK